MSDAHPAARSRSPGEARAWLATRPGLDELRAAYPQDWAAVEGEIAELTARGDVEELKAHVLRLASEPPAAGRSGGRAGLSALVRRQMTAAALRQVCLTAATGVTEGHVRLGLVNGKVAQRLLFEGSGLRRKAVSNRAFSLVWPRLPQRRLIMPLVERQGIYCFYSRGLIDALAELIAGRSCLEIAAGDGTLSRLLGEAGVAVTATDDHSWSHSIAFPEEVEALDARAALEAHAPQVVLSSWPPAGNPFEAAIFATESVESYVMIGSRHAFASGNHAAYAAQGAFEWGEDPTLSALVLPPEVEPAVWVFARP